jgi:O-antigen ligase
MTRQLIIFFAALAALLGSLVTAWATADARDNDLRGYVDAAADSNLPFRIPRLGVNVELTQYSPDELAAQFDLMQRAHVTWVRQFVRWDEIEAERGTYDWAQWDEIASSMSNYPDLHLVAVLTRTPMWARPQPLSDDPTTPPDDPSTFAAFASAFAQRYGKTIDYYQIWDEPNILTGWGLQEPRVASYLALLEASYEAIHAADANATVIAAALAPTTETGPNNVSDLIYLHDLYALGAQPFMDAVAAKPYGFNTSPEDRTVGNDTLNFSRIVALREEMVRNGDGTKPLWASNWGWNSLPDEWTGQPSIWGSVTSDQRTAYTLAALDRADREWAWLGGMVLYHWQPAAPSDDPIWGFSLLDQQDAPTPLLYALIQRQPSQAAANGLYAPTTPFARYSGVWTFGPLGADIGWIQDSQLQLSWWGRDLSLLLRKDNYVAYLYPTIDGQQANAAPRDASGNAYLILTSGSREPELSLVPIARDLPPGQHTLHIVTDRGSDRWALVGYAIGSGSLAEPYNRQITIALITAAVAAVGAAVSGWFIDWHRLFRPAAALWTRLSDAAQFVISIVTSLALLVGMLLTWGEATPALFRREPVQLILAILTAGLLYLNPGLILTATTLIVLFVIFYHRPDFALTLVVFWAPFFLFPVELYKFAFPIAEMLVLIAGAAWLLRLLASWGRWRQSSVAQIPLPSLRDLIRRWQPLDFAMLAWLVLGVVSLAWAEHTREAVTELRTMIFEPVLFYAIFRTTPQDKKSLVRLVDALLLAGFVVAVIGLFLFVQGESIITAEEGARRLASVYGSPNNVGLFLGRCIPFALAYLLLPIDRPRRIVAALFVALMLLAVALTLSAGALFIGVPAAIVAVLLLAWGRRALLPLVGLIAVGAAAFAVAMRSARFARLVDFSEGTNFYRLRVWQSAFNVIHDHSITGLGLDQFLYAYRGHYILPDAWQEPNLSHPHNILLDFWVRLGIFGVLLLLWIQVIFWRTMRAVYRHFRSRDPLLFALAVGAMGSMVNLLAHGLVDNSVFVQDLCYVFVLLQMISIKLWNMRAIDVEAEIMV